MIESIYTTDQIQHLLTPVFRRNQVRKAVLFGSYGKGEASTKSDIDLLVDSGLRGLKFVGLLGEISDAVKKNVDLIDITHIEGGSLIEKEIEATGVLIYEK
jgi:predicted nucleotidyltransferase